VLVLTGVAHGAQSCDSTITSTTPTTRFTVAKDGTVVDTATGLTWKQCTEGQTYSADTSTCSGTADTYNWQQALQRAQAVNQGKGGNAAGYNDWRVPNVKELRSIVEQACREPAVDPSNRLFPLTRSAFYWSSSPAAGTVGQAWGVDFTDGSASLQSMTEPSYLRLVRGGL